MGDQLPVELVEVLLLDLLALLQVLYDLLVMAVLLLQACREPWVHAGLLHLPLEKDPQPLRFLDVEGQLRLKLLDLRELHGLLEVEELLFLAVAEVLDFFHL